MIRKIKQVQQIRQGAIINCGILFLIMFAGCSKTPTTMGAWLKWLHDPSHGLVKERTVNGIEMRVTYMPPDYMAYNDAKNGGTNDEKNYQNQLTFMLTLQPTGKFKKVDLMTGGIHDYKQYTKEVMTMNFDFSQYITLKTDKGTYKPVLTNLENTYGLTGYRNIILVFADTSKTTTDLLQAKNYDLIYNDEQFSLGINHFRFERSSIQDIPPLPAKK